MFRINSEFIRYFEVANSMRSVYAIAFLLIYLSVNTELHQALRFPALFTHYHEHQQQNKAISITEFIILHYFSGDVKDSDYEKDQQLPFKSHCVESFISIAVPPENFAAPISRTFCTAQKIVTHLPVLNTPSVHFSIWQPPKLV